MPIDNVLLITIDSLRYDHFVPFKRTYSTADKKNTSLTDTLTELPPFASTTKAPLEKDAIAFESAFATGPGTGPSFPALLTGTLPLSYSGLGPLSADRPRVATQLNTAGLATGGFHSNPFLSHHFNYDVGFDTFTDYQNPLMGIATKIFPRGIEINNPKLSWIDKKLRLTSALKRAYQTIKGKPRPYVSADVITEDTIAWLEQVDGTFFAWAHYMDVHHPCFPPEAYRTEYDVADVTHTEVAEWYAEFATEDPALTEIQVEKLHRLYNASIAYTVDQVGRIIDYVYHSGQYEETLIILTSDHGELFGDHGQYGKTVRMYDELLHVPLLIANGPEYLGDVATDLVSLLDLPPLMHDALGLDVPDTYEGRRIGRDAPREFVLAEHEVDGNPNVGARSDHWLYEGDEISGEHRLFDLSDGQFSRRDTADPEAQLVRQAVFNRLETLDIDARHLRDEVDGDIESRLEDLGYL